MTAMVWFWAAAFVVFVITEVATFTALVSVWFAVGALAAMFCAMADVAFVWQMAVFIGVSAFVLLITRPIVRKLQGEKKDTNYELEVGKQAVVVESINNSTAEGRVKLDGVDWAARSEDSSQIGEGEVVTVKKVDGAKLIVSR